MPYVLNILSKNSINFVIFFQKTEKKNRREWKEKENRQNRRKLRLEKEKERRKNLLLKKLGRKK